MSQYDDLLALANAANADTPIAFLVHPVKHNRTEYKQALLLAEVEAGIKTMLEGQFYFIPWHNVKAIKVPRGALD